MNRSRNFECSCKYFMWNIKALIKIPPEVLVLDPPTSWSGRLWSEQQLFDQWPKWVNIWEPDWTKINTAWPKTYLVALMLELLQHIKVYFYKWPSLIWPFKTPQFVPSQLCSGLLHSCWQHPLYQWSSGDNYLSFFCFQNSIWWFWMFSMWALSKA